MKKFVVTGGCGFIGSHLVELLVYLGHSVIIIDDLSSGFRSNIENISGDILIHSKKLIVYFTLQLKRVCHILLNNFLQVHPPIC